MMSIITLTCTAHNIDNRSVYNITDFVEDCLEELNVPDSINIIIVSSTNRTRFASVEPCTISYDYINTYVIVIDNTRSYNDYIKILAHEIVHVEQLSHKRLIHTTIAKYNEEYDKAYTYDVKFEKEANDIGAELIAKFLTIML